MSDDLHARFQAWLRAGAEDDPPRDVALHASLCPDCLRWITAHDSLLAIDTGRAPLPLSRPLAEPSAGWRQAARFAAGAISMLVIGGVLAFGAGRLISGRLAPGQAQEVLSVTGSPAPTTPLPVVIASSASVDAGGSVAPSSSTAPSPTAAHSAAARVTPPPTPRPTSRGSRAPSAAPATPSPTPAPTATATASATATPTPAATDTPTPSPSAS